MTIDDMAERNDDEPTQVIADWLNHLQQPHVHVYEDYRLCVICREPKGPTTPKPHVHKRFKLIYSADMREVVFRICEDCQYADTDDYWRGWEARGVKDATA